jgi:hypothetical protein
MLRKSVPKARSISAEGSSNPATTRPATRQAAISVCGVSSTSYLPGWAARGSPGWTTHPAPPNATQTSHARRIKVGCAPMVSPLNSSRLTTLGRVLHRPHDLPRRACPSAASGTRPAAEIVLRPRRVGDLNNELWPHPMDPRELQRRAEPTAARWPHTEPGRRAKRSVPCSVIPVPAWPA